MMKINLLENKQKNRKSIQVNDGRVRYRFDLAYHDDGRLNEEIYQIARQIVDNGMTIREIHCTKIE
ncbi:hypothetical protein ACFLRF_04715 [Candidatus Altiarchaeota archaeon]